MSGKVSRERIYGVAWLGLLVFVVYGRTLSLPFFSDDFFQLPFLDAHSFGDLWVTAEGLFFFRPLAFSIWKLWFWLLGDYQPAAFHALNLLLHWLNAVLVFWLTARLWPGQNNRLKAAVAATLFSLFPFSYEAVAWVAAVMHPLFLTLTLLSLAAYLQMRRSRQPRLWLAAGLFLALLSPFAHENGVLTAPLVGILALTRPKGGRLTRDEIGTAALWFLPVLLWFLVWWQVPARDGAGGLALNSPDTMLQNALYFLQGLGYPLAWLGGRLRDDTALGSTGAALAASLPAVLVLLIVRWRAGMTRRSLLPWLWTAVAVAPPILFLPNLHVIAAPRMFMLPAVGIVWLWMEAFWYFYAGKAGLPPVSSRLRRHYRLGLAAVLVIGLLLQNLAFIGAQLNLYRIGGTAIAQAGPAANEANDEGRTAVFLNFPTWIAPFQATYAVGQEGDILILGPDMLEPLVWAHTGRPANTTAVRYDDIRLDMMPYHTAPAGDGPDWPALLAEGAAIYVCRYEPDAIRVEPAARLAVSAPGGPSLAVFGDSVVLLAAAAESNGEQTRLNLTWQVIAPAPFELTVFVHGLDETGMLIEQTDGDPVAGTFPFGLWPPGTIVQDTRIVPTGQVQTFLVGLYNRYDGTRERATAPNGRPFPDNAVPVEIGSISRD